MANDDGRRRTRDTWHIMMFSKPKTVEAPFFSVLSKINTISERLFGCGPFVDHRQIKDRQRNALELLSQLIDQITHSPLISRRTASLS